MSGEARLELCEKPSPVRQVDDAVWVKDEGPLGGNKVRKLEYTLAVARRTVLTFGAIGSHHAVATARACAQSGRRCVLALVDQPEDDHVREQLAAMRGAGARILRTRTVARTYAAVPYLLARYRPTVLPVGGSSPRGVRGWIDAAEEIAQQVRAGELPRPARIVVAVGSGGTAAGLIAGLPPAGLGDVEVLGVLVNDRTRVDVPRLARRALRAHGPTTARASAPTRPGRYQQTRDFLGAGYGEPTEAGREAIDEAAAHGLALEPVYTAKAWAAMRALPAAGPTLFVQTYAAPQ